MDGSPAAQTSASPSTSAFLNSGQPRKLLVSSARKPRASTSAVPVKRDLTSSIGRAPASANPSIVQSEVKLIQLIDTGIPKITTLVEYIEKSCKGLRLKLKVENIPSPSDVITAFTGFKQLQLPFTEHRLTSRYFTKELDVLQERLQSLAMKKAIMVGAARGGGRRVANTRGLDKELEDMKEQRDKSFAVAKEKLKRAIERLDQVVQLQKAFTQQLIKKESEITGLGMHGDLPRLNVSADWKRASGQLAEFVAKQDDLYRALAPTLEKINMPLQFVMEGLEEAKKILVERESSRRQNLEVDSGEEEEHHLDEVVNAVFQCLQCLKIRQNKEMQALIEKKGQMSKWLEELEAGSQEKEKVDKLRKELRRIAVEKVQMETECMKLVEMLKEKSDGREKETLKSKLKIKRKEETDLIARQLEIWRAVEELAKTRFPELFADLELMPESFRASSWEAAAVQKAQAVVRRWLARRRFKQIVEMYRSSSLSESKSLQRRNGALREILSSEASYVRGLKILIEVFLQPLRTASLATADQIQHIFSNIEMIYQLHTTFLENLEEEFKKWPTVNVGQIFKDLSPFLKTYTLYVNNYNQALATLNLLQKRQGFAAFLHQAVHAPENATHLDLPSLLITPVQRIPRYVLLLNEVVRNTPPGFVDKDELTTALTDMRKIADHIDESKRKSDNFTTALKIQNRFVGAVVPLVQGSRRFVREARVSLIIERSGSASEESGWELFLFDDLLLIAREKKGIGIHHAHASNALEQKHVVYLAVASVNDVRLHSAKLKHVIEVGSIASGMMKFKFDKAEEKQRWMQDLPSLITEEKKKLQTKVIRLYDEKDSQREKKKKKRKMQHEIEKVEVQAPAENPEKSTDKSFEIPELWASAVFKKEGAGGGVGAKERVKELEKSIEEDLSRRQVMENELKLLAKQLHDLDEQITKKKKEKKQLVSIIYKTAGGTLRRNTAARHQRMITPLADIRFESEQTVKEDNASELH